MAGKNTPFGEGNQWWRQAAGGRPRKFDTPEDLWNAAIEYFEQTDGRKWQEKDWVGKDARQVTREYTIPYTISGFCIFVGASRRWWNNFRDARKKDEDADFLEVISRIEDVMWSQKFEGAAVNAFNSNIIARDLGLVDKSHVEQTVEQPLFGEGDDDPEIPAGDDDENNENN